MGTLKPGATYIYERVGETIYARESGSDPSTREIIGYDYRFVDNSDCIENIVDRYYLEVEWADILHEAKTNLVLHDAVERVKIIYHLSKKEDG